MTDPSPNRRINLALIPKASAALDQAMTATGLSATDVLNRAVQVYAAIEERLAVVGDELLARDRDGNLSRVRIIESDGTRR